MQRTVVWVTHQYVAFHRWADAPAEVMFLREYHRHVFHVKLGVEVSHGDRDVEFFILKDRLANYCSAQFKDRYMELSCEQMATQIVNALHGAWCEVSEDGENGAWVEGLPACRKKTKCFVGTECEGPHAGDTVFFVPGSVTPERFQRAWSAYLVDHSLPYRIYYGAGNDHALNEATLYSIIKTAENINVEGIGMIDGIDVELAPGPMTPTLHARLKNPRITCIGVKGFVGSGECRWVKKVTSDTIYWFAYDKDKSNKLSDAPAYSTPINHNAFNNDVDVE